MRALSLTPLLPCAHFKEPGGCLSVQSSVWRSVLDGALWLCLRCIAVEREILSFQKTHYSKCSTSSRFIVSATELPAVWSATRGSPEGNCSVWSFGTYRPVETNRVDHSVSSQDLYMPSERCLFISRCEVLKSRSSGSHWGGLEAAGWVQHIKGDYVQAQVSITFL